MMPEQTPSGLRAEADDSSTAIRLAFKTGIAAKSSGVIVALLSVLKG